MSFFRYMVRIVMPLALLFIQGCTHPCTSNPERCADELHLYEGPEQPASAVAKIVDVSGRYSLVSIKWSDETLIYHNLTKNYFEPDLKQKPGGAYLYSSRVPNTFYLLPDEYWIFLRSQRRRGETRDISTVEYGLVKLEAGQEYRVDFDFCSPYFMFGLLADDCSPYSGEKIFVFLESVSTGELLLGRKVVDTSE